VAEKLRYGEPSTAAESIYDRPFQWGSRRIGPDLARVGGKYPDMWHYRHMLNPREVTQKSIMPNYPWLFEKNTEFGILTKKLKVMKSLGVPYSDSEVENAVLDAKKQAESIVNEMTSSGVSIKMKDKQIIALIAYLQRLGKDTKTQAEVTAQVNP
jgi:cytochrome c oxidase cbb3-type subunit I/II